MPVRLAIVYNEPTHSRYDTAGEKEAVWGVLQSVAAVHQASLELGYGVTLRPLAPPLESARRKLPSLHVDLVFNLFEGFCGYPETEALLPEALSGLGIPFTGCPAAVLRLARDKAEVKVILKAAGIPTPDFQLLNRDTLSGFRLGYPCIVKPRGEDASHGLSEASVVPNFALLEKQVRMISQSYGGDALVEEFIDGREFNATVLGNAQPAVLPVSEINYSLPPEMARILTFAAKWQPGSVYFRGTKVVCPAEVTNSQRADIVETARAVYRLLGCRGYARVDLRRDSAGRLNVIELNPNPDISPEAGTARQAAAAGMTYPQFIDRIIQMALEQECHDHRDTPHVSARQTGPDENTARHPRVQAV